MMLMVDLGEHNITQIITTHMRNCEKNTYFVILPKLHYFPLQMLS